MSACLDFSEVISYQSKWDAAWQCTAVGQCPCVSQGVWLFSSICPHPAGPQSDKHDSLLSLPFFLSSISLHNAFSSLSPSSLSPSCFVSASDVLLKGTKRTQVAELPHISVPRPLFLFNASAFWAQCMYNLVSLAGHLSFYLLSSDAGMTHLPEG